MKGGSCPVTWVSKILVLVGAINWGLVGAGGFMEANWNVVNLLLGSWPTVEWIVYILVGVAGLFLCWKMFTCGSCDDKK